MGEASAVTALRTWTIGPISTPTLAWGARRAGREHKCSTCGIKLLTGEESGFCCGPGGSKYSLVPSLPPLPPEYNTFINHPKISSLSRILNLIFSFASLETTAAFPSVNGPPGFMAIQGRVYHRVRPGHQDSAVRWLLYDGFMRHAAPHQDWVAALPPGWMEAVTAALDRYNPFVRHLRSLSQLDPVACPNAELILKDSGEDEIAAVMCYENTSRSQIQPRSIIISRHNSDNNTSLPIVSRLWEPLAYPLLFPAGTLGWGIAGSARDVTDGPSNARAADTDPDTTQIWHYRARILREPRFSIFGRLCNEYAVDMFSRNLEARLHYIRTNQLRVQQQEAELMGTEFVPDSENIYLPASFLGSNRWASEQISDSLAIAATYGPPTFFITMTCNANWPEIQSQLRPGQDFHDVPAVVCRVFRRKLMLLEKALKTMFPQAGGVLYLIHSVEFQKRGLPHAHILIKYASDCVDPSDIDAVISAEMPSDPVDAELVQQFMIHHHPDPKKPPSKYCQREATDGTRTCRFNYPKDIVPQTHTDATGRVHYRRRSTRDAWVVPHCLALLRKFRCHLNFEAANSSHLFQYIFKYIHKGPDRAKFRVVTPGSESQADPIDEIEEYWSARYLSAGEAVWRILGFHITKKEPSVTALPVHLPSRSTAHRQYSRKSGGGQQTLSLLERYFRRPPGFFVLDGHPRTFASLTYAEYFALFRLAKYDHNKAGKSGYFEEQNTGDGALRMHVVRRQATSRHVCRLQPARPSEGDRFYLRTILQHHPVASFEDATTANGVQYPSFQDAANALGLFAHENEAEQAMVEAITALRTPRQLRVLFVCMLVNDCVPAPRMLWDMHQVALAKDFILQHQNVEQLGIQDALQELGRFLEEYGKSLSHYGLPEPSIHTAEVQHELERWYPQREAMRLRAEAAMARFNPEQKVIADAILHAVTYGRPLCVFVDGRAGRGKTFLVNAICDWIRARDGIVLATATSAYAAQLYPGGRTTHSTFKVPVNENNEFLEAAITNDSPRADLIREAEAVIWDEGPMANCAVFACIEETTRRIMRSNVPFGGKVVIVLGDFRQTCPVIRRGTQAQVIKASIRSSPLWQLFTVHRLTIPIRNAADPEFAEFVDAIGDGAGPEVSLDLIEHVPTVNDLIDFVYPPTILTSPESCLQRSILAPTNAQVDSYNDIIINRISGVQRTYLAADSLKEIEDAGIQSPDTILDYVARQTPPGFPPHSLTVKVNAVYRLMRNLSIDRGLVKNVRVVVIAVGSRLVTVRLLRGVGGVGTVDAEDILLPRITFSMTLDSGHTLLRKQFPLAPAYATTFNSCQGLTLDVVGVDLIRPVFSHGQLYTALSRIRHRTHGRVRLPPGQTTTTNVTFKEILL